MNYEKVISNIYVMVTTAGSPEHPVGTIIKVSDIRDPRAVIGIIYGCDTTLVTDPEAQNKLNRAVGSQVKLPSNLVSICPSNVMHGCLERYCLPEQYYSNIEGKVVINKKNDCYFISPQIIPLLDIDVEMVKETRLKFVHSGKGMYICSTFSDSDELEHTPFTLEESGAIKISAKDTKVLEEMFREYFETKDVDEVVIGKMPTVIKVDRLSYSQGFRVVLEGKKENLFRKYESVMAEEFASRGNGPQRTVRPQSGVMSGLDPQPQFEDEPPLDENMEAMINNINQTNPTAAEAIRRVQIDRQRERLRQNTRGLTGEQITNVIFGDESIIDN